MPSLCEGQSLYNSSPLSKSRRGTQKLPVTDITIFLDASESVPPGFEAIKESVAGQSANLNSGKWFANSMTLCFTRKEKLCEHDGQPCRAVVEDIVVINTGRGESVPEGYTMVEMSRKGAKLDLNAGMRISTANAAFIALKHVSAFLSCLHSNARSHYGTKLYN